MDYLDRVASLPEQMTEIAIGPDFLTDGVPELQQRLRVVHHEIRVHFKPQALHSMLARELRRFLPVRNDLLLPLPFQHFLIFRRPAVVDPVRLSVSRRSSR